MCQLSVGRPCTEGVTAHNRGQCQITGPCSARVLCSVTTSRPMLTPAQVIHHPAARWIGAVIAVVLTLHLLLSSTGSTSFVGRNLNGSPHELWYLGKQRPASFVPTRDDLAQAESIGRGAAVGSGVSLVESATFNISRENATFVTLCRNSDLWEILGSMRGIEGERKDPSAPRSPPRRRDKVASG